MVARVAVAVPCRNGQGERRVIVEGRLQDSHRPSD